MWYTKRSNLLVKPPILLPKRGNLVWHPLTGDFHPLLGKTRLMACRLSGLPQKNRDLFAKQQTVFPLHGEQARQKHTDAPSVERVFCLFVCLFVFCLVQNGTKILFDQIQVLYLAFLLCCMKLGRTIAH